MLTTAITFAGNLVEDPELRFTPSGKAVTTFVVLVNRRVKVNGEWEDGTPTRYECELWNDEAENLAESVIRGTRVIVHGEVITESWEDREHGTRYRQKVRVEEVGASLRWATAKVTRSTRSTAANQDQDQTNPWTE